MGLKDLEDFLKSNDEEQKIDWESQKKEWINAIAEFYKNVTSWLQPLAGANLDIHFETVVLNEEYIGQYETKNMVLIVKGQKVSIEPKGTLIIGAKGRIDMMGTYGSVRFLYVDKNLKHPNITVRVIDSASGELLTPQDQPNPDTVEYEWKIATFPPNIQYIPLNEETFSNSLLSVIRHG